MPITKGVTDVAPLKINDIELLNIVNDPDFDLNYVPESERTQNAFF